jgi:hypothetical protein
LYPVPYYDTETFAYYGKILIPWCIQGPATEKAGKVKFAIRFYSVNAEHKLSYSLRTLVAESLVLEGQNTNDEDISPDNIDLDNELIEFL